MVAGGLAVIYLLPRLTRAVPAPLVAIVLLTAGALSLGVTVPTVGDMGRLPDALPFLGAPAVPLTLETCASSRRTPSRWRSSGSWSR